MAILSLTGRGPSSTIDDGEIEQQLTDGAERRFRSVNRRITGKTRETT